MNKGLRRFRAALAEIEKEVDICPDCDTILTLALNFDAALGVPGEIAALMPYRYCERCKNYYLHGRRATYT